MDFMGMMKQATELKSKMEAMQAELDHIEVEGAAGGGMVTVKLTAKGDLKAVAIDPSLMKPDEKEIVEDLVVTDSELPRQSIVGGASVYPFVQNVLLGLRAEGLGAALTTLLIPAEADVKRLLEIPDEIALAAHIGVGYRAEPWPKRLARKPVEEFAFGERFGDPLA